MDSFSKEYKFGMGNDDFDNLIKTQGRLFFEQFLSCGENDYRKGYEEGYCAVSPDTENDFVANYIEGYKNEKCYENLSKDDFIEIAKLAHYYFYLDGYSLGEMEC
jgi:hypothetical protein